MSHQIDYAIISTHPSERGPITNGKMKRRYISYRTKLVLTSRSDTCLSSAVAPFIRRFRMAFHQSHINHIIRFIGSTCQTHGACICYFAGIMNNIFNKTTPVLIIYIRINRLYIIVYSRNTPSLCIINRNTILRDLHDIYQLMQ